MPYIAPERRLMLDRVASIMNEAGIQVDGDLNYLLFKYCLAYVPANYKSYKNFLGELNECSAEIRRRILSPYEDKKCREHGDVI